MFMPSPAASCISTIRVRARCPRNYRTRSRCPIARCGLSVVPAPCSFSWVLTRDSNLGDLTGGAETAGKILFSFELVTAEAGGLTLDRRFDLGVGGEGIIGRFVSVVRKDVVLGEGTIGGGDSL